MKSRSAIASLTFGVMLAMPFAGVGVALSARAAGAASVPGAPRSVSVIPFKSGGAKVTWKAPADGGSPITGYRVTPYLGTRVLPVRTFFSARTTETVSGLKNGKSYRFRVAARNAVGTGAQSASSRALIVGVPGQPTTPFFHNSGLPRGEVKVVFMWPLRNGDIDINFTATCKSSNGGATRIGTGRKNSDGVDVSDLTFDKTYRCTVVASNKWGSGIPSKPSAPITI